MKTTNNNIITTITTIDELHYADVEAMNVDTLKATCKALGITGYSRLNKNALQTILLEAIDERINQQCQANLAWCDEMSTKLASTCTCGHDATSERLAAAITAGLVYVIVTTTCDMQGASYLQADIAERLTITEAIAVAAQTRHDYDMWLLAYAADHTEATIEQLGTEQAIRLVHDRDALIDLTYVTAAHIEQLSLAEAETIEEATEEQPTITIGTEAIDQVWDAINANSGERNHEMVLSYEAALNRSCGNVARLSTESILTILGTDDIYGIRGSVREAVISARNILNFCGADESIAAQAVRELIAEKAAQAGAIIITKPEATKTEPSTETLAEAVHELAAKRDALDAAEHDVFYTRYTMGVTPEQVAKAVERRDGIAAQYEDAKRRVDALSSALDTKATEDEATETLTITTERQHIASIDAHVYIESDGSYVYQDMCGYRTYKTLQGLNRYVQSAAKTANRKAPEIVEATKATKVAADATKQPTKSVKDEATTTTVDADGEVADEGTTIDERGEIVESDENETTTTKAKKSYAKDGNGNVCAFDSRQERDTFVRLVNERVSGDRLMAPCAARDAYKVRDKVAEDGEVGAKYYDMRVLEFFDGDWDVLDKMWETVATETTTTDHVNYSYLNSTPWQVACYCCDSATGSGCNTDRFAFNFWMRTDVDAALAENVRDAREMVADCIDHAAEYLITGEEVEALADELRMLDAWLDVNEVTRLVGTIERDGYAYPVTCDEDGYHVDLGGATGVSDGMEFDDDPEALEGIADIIDREAEDMATETDENTYRAYLEESTKEGNPKMANIYVINNGRDVLHRIVDGIRTGNDTADWTDCDWQKALQDEIEIVGEREPGDVNAMVAYLIACFDGDVLMTARIGMYGFATVIADCVYAAMDLGETCELFD